MTTAAYPQISYYAPIEVDPVYVIVFGTYIWEVAELIGEYDELDIHWYELQSLEDGDDLTFCARANDCKILPGLMTVEQYIDGLLKGNLT